MDDFPPDVVRRAERQVNSIFAKVIGGVMLWIGVAAFGLLIWASYKLTLLDRHPELGAFVFLAVIAVVGAFCALVGWRLFLNRPNRFGSILGPVGWRILGGMFAMSTVAFLIFGFALLRENDFPGDMLATFVTAIVGAAIFSRWCLLSARRASANAAKSDHGAL